MVVSCGEFVGGAVKRPLVAHHGGLDGVGFKLVYWFLVFSLD